MKKLFKFLMLSGIFFTIAVIGIFSMPISNHNMENEKETFVKISLDKFTQAKKVNHPLGNFTIMLEGYSTMYDTPPDIELEDDSGNIIWTNYDDIDHIKSDHTLPIEFCKEYKFNDVGGPLTINKTGTYKMIFSFGDVSLERELLMLESISHVGLDKSDLRCP